MPAWVLGWSYKGLMDSWLDLCERNVSICKFILKKKSRFLHLLIFKDGFLATQVEELRERNEKLQAENKKVGFNHYCFFNHSSFVIKSFWLTQFFNITGMWLTCKPIIFLYFLQTVVLSGRLILRGKNFLPWKVRNISLNANRKCCGVYEKMHSIRRVYFEKFYIQEPVYFRSDFRQFWDG